MNQLRYLDSFPCELGSSSSALKRSGLVEPNQTFVILKSYSSCDTRTSGASVHLRTHLNQLNPGYVNTNKPDVLFFKHLTFH